MARVEFEHVSKRYGTSSSPPVVRDLSLTIHDRELLALVGPSGCGKSTALRMIAGLEAITAGSLFIDGRRVNDVAPKDRDVAMVFQNYALYPHMTSFDNMAFALTLRKIGRAEIERRVRDAARVLGIEALLGRKPKELSGGQRQRVAIGRAIVREPRVFLMDEPLSNLDAKLRSAMRAELKRLHRELGATIVYVTHDQIEAMTLGDRVAVMNAGELQQVGTPEEVYRRPANVFVAAFFGASSMNLVRGGHVHAPRAPHTREIVVGVRPEHLTIGGAGEVSFEGTVEMTEWAGTEKWVHLATSAGRLVCRAGPEGVPAIGRRARASAAEGDVHRFDAVTEERLA
jgi:multiple sugar transport system ATP-binding protein